MGIKFGSEILSNYKGDLNITAVDANVTVKDYYTQTQIQSGIRKIPVGTYSIRITPKDGYSLALSRLNGVDVSEGGNYELKFGENFTIEAYAEQSGSGSNADTLYFKPNSNWLGLYPSDFRFALYAYGSNGEKWFDFEQDLFDSGLFKIPNIITTLKTYTGIIITSMNARNTANNWNNKNNQSSEITVASLINYNYNLITQPNGTWNQWTAQLSNLLI